MGQNQKFRRNQLQLVGVWNMQQTNSDTAFI